jgi:hypothetical protein
MSDFSHITEANDLPAGPSFMRREKATAKPRRSPPGGVDETEKGEHA